MFRHLMVPLDGSDYALLALRKAEELAKLTGARLTILTVLLRPEGPDAIHVNKLDERSREQAESGLVSIVTEVKARTGLEAVDSEVRFGAPAHQITEYANATDLDLIVMSTHGLGATGQYALGSVALKVLMTAHCPVLMVRIPSHGAAQD